MTWLPVARLEEKINAVPTAAKTGEAATMGSTMQHQGFPT